MELTYNDLRKRDVINVADGRCLGRICDLKLRFPEGKFLGITVPGRRNGFFGFFSKNPIYISERNIIKIGGDVILVDLRCGETCSESVDLTEKREKKVNKRPPSPCSSFCPPPCSSNGQNEGRDYSLNEFDEY